MSDGWIIIGIALLVTGARILLLSHGDRWLGKVKDRKEDAGNDSKEESK